MPDRIQTDSTWHDAQVVAIIVVVMICIVPIAAIRLCQIAYKNWTKRRAETDSNRSSN